MKYCYNCGAQLSGEITVCPMCHAPQDALIPDNQTNHKIPFGKITSNKIISKPKGRYLNNSKKPPIIKMSLLVIVALIIVIIFVLIIFNNMNHLKVSGNHFNFTDEELIDYVNTNLPRIQIESEDLDISDGNRTDYRISYDDDSGILVLDHINGKVCSMFVTYFDESSNIFALLSLIASEIDPDFITDTDYAAFSIVTNNVYTSTEMSIIGEDRGGYLLAPNEFVLELLDD